MYNACMHRPLYSLAASVVLGVVFLGCSFGEHQFSAIGQTPQNSKAATQVLFDDFNYADRSKLAQHGWIVRSASGWPGIPGAKWPQENVSLIADAEKRGNWILRMTSS